MTPRRTLLASLLALLALGSSVPALAAGPVDPKTQNLCVFTGSDPASRHGICINYPLRSR
ncbi:MAG: hypothetical protein JWN17_2494 [Frankiales bacterium]|nr:hypothetical protein [Frankiales bacterium]